jgi:hypothetical protein
MLRFRSVSALLWANLKLVEFILRAMYFSPYNLFTAILGLATILLGLHYFRIAQRTPESEMIQLQEGVNVSRRIAYYIVFFLWFVGALLTGLAILITILGS